MARGGAEQVEEYLWRARKVATGSVWRGKGWRGELHSELGGGGGHGGGGGRSRRKGARGAGSRAQGGRREG